MWAYIYNPLIIIKEYGIVPNNEFFSVGMCEPIWQNKS